MVKVLVSGDTKGRFDTLFQGAKRANDKAGPFAALFCVGQFFGPSGRYLGATMSINAPLVSTSEHS